MSQFWFKFDIQAILSRKALIASLVPLAVSAGSTASGQSTVKLVQLPFAVPSVLQRSMLVSHKDSTDIVHVAINLASTNPSGLQAFVNSVNNPKSPSYHKWAKPAELGTMFGQPAAKVQSVVTYLQSKGFKIKLVGASHMMILADATVAQAEAAFDTTINNYHALNSTEPGRINYYSFSEPLHAPATFSSVVNAVCGLDNISIAHPLLKKHVAAAAKTSARKGKLNTNPLTPTQTRVLYGVAPMYNNSLQGQTANIAINNFDGYRLTHVPLYYSEFNLPTPTGGVGSNITVVTVDGGSGTGTPAGEGDLDIQMVLGMAPLSNFTIYDGAGSLTDVITKEQEDNKVDIISESYGFILGSSDEAAVHAEHLLLSAQGVTYMAATGDTGTDILYGYSDYEPEVLKVGGTVADTDNSGNRLDETGWSGSGGSWVINSSPFNVLPSWQTGSGVPTNINYRLFPDVALNAAGASTGAYQFYLNGTLNFDYDGTSFACPVFAGSFGVTEQQIFTLGGTERQGRINDTIYAQNGRPDVWYDITSGENGALPNGGISACTPFWDFVTGWGAINFYAYAQSVAVSPPQYLPVATVNAFDNTLLPKPVIEGTSPIGSASTLASGSGYSLLAVDEPAVGEVATVQATFSSIPVGTTTAISNSQVKSLSLVFSGTASPEATIMIYALDQTVGTSTSGKYTYLKSLSGTAFGSPTTLTLTNAQLATFLPATGSPEFLIRYLVPNDRLTQVNSFTFSLSQLQVSVILSLSS